MQRLLNYLHYFFFFSYYFNPLLAARMLSDEVRGERKYRLRTTGIQKTKRLAKGSINAANAHHYMPSNYVLLEDVFRFLSRQPNNQSFLDIGCGKGRVLFVAERFGYRRIIGVELVDAYCRFIEQEVKRKKLSSGAQVETACTDAATYVIPSFVQTIFLYNPFNEQVMQPVISNILRSLQQTPRSLYLVYFTPLYRQQLMAAGFEEIYRATRFGYLKAAVFRNKYVPGS